MKAAPIIAVAGLGLLAIGGVALAANASDDESPPLPVPPNGDCLTTKDVGEWVAQQMGNTELTAKEYRDAAATLREIAETDEVCDENAATAAISGAVLLEGRALALEQGRAGPGASPTSLPGVPGLNDVLTNFPMLTIPAPGWTDAKEATGLHGEDGIVYIYPTGDMWFVPVDRTLSPYFVPGGSTDIKTSGDYCCASCANGGECEGCG